MRLRNVKGSRETIAADDYTITDDIAPEYKGRWHEVFGNNNPIYIEIGMGKGRFITENARMDPNSNYVGIEKYSSVLIKAVAKQQEEKLPNIRFIRMDAENICDVFARREVAGIFLNFSDPWPKDRHAKRRLTSDRFLQRYTQILTDDAKIIFKTDNRPLFDFSVEQAKAEGWKLLEVNYDLHKEGNPEGNVMTEYETKFTACGNPINRMIITYDKL